MKSYPLCLILALAVGCQTAQQGSKTDSAGPSVPRAQDSQLRPNARAVGAEYAISTQGEFSSRAAEKMFQLGGNIIDAAVAASFAVSVERPQSTGLGGGGFFLYHEAKSQKTYAIDFRERAPGLAFERMYLGRDGKPDPNLSQNGVTAAAVPGLVAGLIEIHQRFGRLPLAKTLEPAIELAENGFSVYPDLASALQKRELVLAQDPDAKKLFFTADGRPLTVGSKLIQSQLARSLRLIAKKGRVGFYSGSIAKSLLKLSHEKNGQLRASDLKSYQVKWREPLKGKFGGYQILAMPPPSSGGIHVLQFLGLLEKDPLRELGPLSVEAIHLEAAALQMAFADRAQYLGDPDFVEVPVDRLLARSYLEKRRAEIPQHRARIAEEVSAGKILPEEPSETTHISLLDQEGNAVATTQTINGWMGAGAMIPGTGIILNNEMDDFSAQVGAQNLFGAVGSLANRIEPRKTPLSSMSPTLVLQEGKVILSVGAPGGTRIISCVAQTILNYLEFRMSLLESIASVRLHHQWKPDVLKMELPGPSPAVKAELEKMGYNLKLEGVGCYVMATAREGNNLQSVADPRDIGIAIAR